MGEVCSNCKWNKIETHEFETKPQYRDSFSREHNGKNDAGKSSVKHKFLKHVNEFNRIE